MEYSGAHAHSVDWWLILRQYLYLLALPYQRMLSSTMFGPYFPNSVMTGYCRHTDLPIGKLLMLMFWCGGAYESTHDFS